MADSAVPLATAKAGVVYAARSPAERRFTVLHPQLTPTPGLVKKYSEGRYLYMSLRFPILNT